MYCMYLCWYKQFFMFMYTCYVCMYLCMYLPAFFDPCDCSVIFFALLFLQLCLHVEESGPKGPQKVALLLQVYVCMYMYVCMYVYMHVIMGVRYVNT